MKLLSVTRNVEDQVAVFTASAGGGLRTSALELRQSQTVPVVAAVVAAPAFLKQKPYSTHWLYVEAEGGTVAGATGLATVHERSPWNSSVVTFNKL